MDKVWIIYSQKLCFYTSNDIEVVLKNILTMSIVARDQGRDRWHNLVMMQSDGGQLLHCADGQGQKLSDVWGISQAE